jgi:hypothetical protein
MRRLRRLQERPSPADKRSVRRTRVAAALLVAALVVLAAIPASAAGVEAGSYVHGGFYPGDGFHSTADLDALAAATGKRVSLGGTFMAVTEDWGRPADPNEWSNTREKIDELWRGGTVPFVNLDFPGATAAQVANGSWDSRIQHWVAHVKLYLNKGGGRALIVAPLQEMNGKWTSYGCQPAAFKTAYRRIVQIVRGQGLDETRVRFAWAPNGWTDHGCGSIHDYYPGDDVVDLIGISAYRWAEESVYQVMGAIIDDLAARYPRKPLIIAQTAAWPTGSKQQWIRDVFDWAASHPHVVAVLYFNFNKETDWRVWKNGQLDPGWRDGMRKSTTVYQHPLSSWFEKGPLYLVGKPGKDLCKEGHAKPCDTVVVRESSGLFQIFQYAASGFAKVTKSFVYGRPGDIPLVGDWDCNGTETVGLYRQSDGFVYLKNSNSAGNASISYYFGRAGDIPIVGDFYGDGCDTVSVYRPSEGRFYIINDLRGGKADFSFVFGRIGDKPFVGDFDGDGTDGIGLHRESTGLVFFRNKPSAGWADSEFVYGRAGDKLIAGDWNGDGKDTVAVYRPSNGMLYIKNKNAAGNADAQVWIGPIDGLASMAR